MIAANPNRSFTRLAELLPTYLDLFEVVTRECLTYHGYTEEAIYDKLLELSQSEIIQKFLNFLNDWFMRSHSKLLATGLVDLISRPPTGVIYQQEAIIALFDKFIYLKTLLEILEEKHNITQIFKDLLTEYDHYNELVSLRNGEIKGAQLPRTTSYLTIRMRKDLLEYFDLPIDQWNSLTTIDGKQFLDLQMDCLKNGSFSELALDTLFKDIFELVETPTNSVQSRLLALQPLFRCTHGVKSYGEWCIDQKIAFIPNSALSPDYIQYVKRKLEGIIGS